MSADPLPESTSAALAPWEPWVFIGAIVAGVAGLGLRTEQYHTHSHTIRLLVSIPMLILSVLILVESAFVVFNVGGALEKLSGRGAHDQLTLAERGRSGGNPSARMVCFVLVCGGVALLVYGIRGL